MADDCIKEITYKDIAYQMINIAVKHRRIMLNYLDETGVYQGQHRLLMEISRNPNASQNDIARQMDISAATVAVALKKLESGGYISKEVDEEDNRLNKITITEKGNKVVEQSKQIFEMIERKLFKGFSEEDRHALYCLLTRLDSNLTNMENEIKLEKERA